MTTAVDVVTCGEPMGLFASDHVSSLKDAGRFVRLPAGAELNVAVGLSRLGHKVGFISNLGDDSLGHWLLDVLAGDGIDHRFVTLDPRHPTGLMFKSRRQDGGDPDVEYYRKGSAASAMSVEHYPAEYCRSARHLHITGISPALSQSVRDLIFHMAKDMRAAGKTVSFDPNLRKTLWRSNEEMIDCLNQLAQSSDWIFPGLSEGQLLTGLQEPSEIADFYLARGCSVVVVKLGAQGAYYATHETRGFVAGMSVEQIVDTVGAGDGFAAGVVSALLEGLSVQDAAKRGNAIGARVLGFPGDSDGLPTRAQLAALEDSQTDKRLG